MAGNILKCDPSCKSCSGTTLSDCLSCYQGTTLQGNQCISCTDSNALSCLPFNLAFSTSCIQGYTAAFHSTGGTCQACALNCKKCDQNGPGKCDSSWCFEGFVQLAGTTNCTACFGGCASCNSNDLSVCTSCGVGQYVSNGICSSCGNNCVTCSSGSICVTCSDGWQLISGNCYQIPLGCISLSSATICSSCVSGYVLSNGNTACTLGGTCNSTNSCVICPSSQYLSSGQCLSCPSLPSYCLKCDPNTPANCFQCSTGFYVAAGSCVSCSANCADCSSPNFCKTAASGYYIIPLTNGE